MSLALNSIQRTITSVASKLYFSPLTQMAISNSSTLFNKTLGGLTPMFVRTVIRCHFPKPKEVKRIRVHGWKTRLSTSTGRRIIMRRILKGRHVLTH